MPIIFPPICGENKKRLENVKGNKVGDFLEKIIYFWPAHFRFRFRFYLKLCLNKRRFRRKIRRSSGRGGLCFLFCVKACVEKVLIDVHCSLFKGDLKPRVQKSFFCFDRKNSCLFRKFSNFFPDLALHLVDFLNGLTFP